MRSQPQPFPNWVATQVLSHAFDFEELDMEGQTNEAELTALMNAKSCASQRQQTKAQVPAD